MRHRDAESVSRFNVDSQIELSWLLDGDVARLCTA